MGVTPVFILSVSRSGSTLLQRIVAAHDGVATAPEPWILLPPAYSLRQRGADAEYMPRLLADAVEDFAAGLPNGEDDYLAAIRDFALDLYAKSAGEGTTHFVDKSPPYCLIAEEIIRIFPEAKFVFLWRNPLSVIASMIETWGPWRPTFMTADLFVGWPRLLAAHAAHAERSHAVRFEDAVSGDAATWTALMDYLGIEFDPAALSRFAEVGIEGRMGDPTGRRAYTQLSAAPEDKWRTALANPVRREWCRRYLHFLGAERLAAMGYEQGALLEELAALPRSYENLGTDLWQAAKGVAREPVRVRTRNRRLGMPNVVRLLLDV
ncbi:MAG: sulfotransferase [Solirubrobacterales bacterium]